LHLHVVSGVDLFRWWWWDILLPSFRQFQFKRPSTATATAGLATLGPMYAPEDFTVTLRRWFMRTRHKAGGSWAPARPTAWASTATGIECMQQFIPFHKPMLFLLLVVICWPELYGG
jgi:hypothetical protein